MSTGRAASVAYARPIVRVGNWVYLGNESWWVWEILDKHPALVRYYSGGCGCCCCVFVPLLFTAHLINCAQLINSACK
jgi:hypothetical protein